MIASTAMYPNQNNAGNSQPVIANFYMEHFEKLALASAPLAPTVWFRYVDDTFSIWSHGKEKLEEFLNHLNSIHPNIQFIMEKEVEGHLPFLDVMVLRKTENPPTQTGTYTKTPTTTQGKKEA